MIDANNVRNDNVYYHLEKFNSKYILKIILDKEWLNSNDRQFPVYVDPTISNLSDEMTLYDTYIYPGDTNVNRNEKPYLKAGVEKVYNTTDRINRTLIKFSLPEIGTGSEIISAQLYVVPYVGIPELKVYLMEAHQVTADWTEENANWDNMNDKYSSRVESISEFERSLIEGGSLTYRTLAFDITKLVKKWYQDTPNYGVMIKSCDETYVDENYPMFFSSSNDVDGDPKPVAYISYRSQNGLEEYWNYKKQTFVDGTSFVNTYTGNLTALFNLGKTVGGKLPIDLKLIYNTNDVVVNNSSFFGKGFKLNLEQYISEIDSETLQYTDEDGTYHYFNKGVSISNSIDVNENIYYDEDGLNLEVTKDNEEYVMKDKIGNKKVFTKINNKYYLTKFEDTNENVISILLNSDNSINKITDKFGSEISITYGENNVIVTYPGGTTTINYNNNLLTSITTYNGITQFNYNNVNIISSIVDVTGLKIEYEYYNISPYKVKKVKQYGLNDKTGISYLLEYNANGTMITDNKGRVEILLFNEGGNLVSINNLKSVNDIKSAYSIENKYGVSNSTNKLISDIIPIKYIKNYLKNTSFENDTNYFTIDTKITATMDTTYCNSGLRSLKLISDNDDVSIEQTISVKKGKYYTFSGYFKNDTLSSISLSYTNSIGDEIVKTEQIEKTSEFEREDVTIYYEEDALSDLKIKVTLINSGIVYMDNIQLEEGETVNYYNALENSDFSEGLNNWVISAFKGNEALNASNYMSVVDINENGDKALKVIGNPYIGTRISKKFDIKGKEGDLYTLSFWYKNEGVPSYAPNTGNSVMIFYEPYNDDYGHCILSEELPTNNENVWQHYVYRNRAIEDFKSITIYFNQIDEANNFYLTNLSFYKEVTSGEYSYDENGNLILMEDQSKNSETIKYNSANQITSIINSLGKKVNCEYDKNNPDRLITVFADDGVVNRILYDEFGNPIRMITSKKQTNEITTNNYKIRQKGTNKYFKAELNSIILEENDCSNTIWKIEKNGDYFKIIYALQNNYSISYNNGHIILDNSDQNNLFKLDKKDDNSYNIIFEESTSEGIVAKYLTVENNALDIKNYDGTTSDIDFYIELIDDKITEISQKYDENGKFIESFTDYNNNTVEYQFDSNTGLLKSYINPKGIETSYNYNNKRQITEFDSNGRKIYYQYNDKNLLSQLIRDNDIYKIDYDDFLNISKVSLGNFITLIENQYESNNGNITGIAFGNGDSVSYEYDDFDRISIFSKMDNVYKYLYDSNGNISKILSNDSIYKFYYDKAKRLYKYKNNDFIAKYKYNLNNDITEREFKLGAISHIAQLYYDDYQNISTMKLDDITINYNYDSLNRNIGKNVANAINNTIEYLKMGKRTSNIINMFIVNNQKYNYKYDELYNITDIFYNDNIINHYEYNDFNELICEINYDTNEKITYNYDNNGNLIKKTITDTLSNNILKETNYEYNNNNWADQLTKYANISISYDDMGNPIQIGNTILTWINGGSLHTYTNTINNLNVSYGYDVKGNRISKSVNGSLIEFKLVNNKIIFEKRPNSVLYYMYDNSGVIGFEYNNNRYFYLKNMQNDIIGITNDSGELLVSYSYDSWGKVLSITDSEGNIVTDSNNIGIINPFRYRSYYYDNETELYCLNNRYYNPEWGRFLSPDSIIGANGDILSCNLYVYVSNNPINNYDSNGNSIISIIKSAVKTITKTVKKVVNTIKKIVSQQKKNLPDYSNELNKVLITNTIEAKYFQKVADVETELEYFYNSVNSDARWDYKVEERWEADIKVPYLGVTGEFIFNGDVITAEDFGNLHFGFIGKAMGFTDKILFMGGGYAAHDGEFDLSILSGPYFGDDPNDHKYIQKGIDMYNELFEEQ